MSELFEMVRLLTEMSEDEFNKAKDLINDKNVSKEQRRILKAVIYTANEKRQSLIA